MPELPPIPPSIRERDQVRWWNDARNKLNDVATLELAATDTASFAGLSIKSQLLQSFTLRLQADEEGLNHAIGEPGSALTAGNFHEKINGASNTLTATPSVNAGVDFVSGGGVSTAAAQIFTFDTIAQTDANLLLLANVVYNDSGGGVAVRATTDESNINTETINRLVFVFTDTTAGTAINLTTYLDVGKIIDVQFYGNIA